MATPTKPKTTRKKKTPTIPDADGTQLASVDGVIDAKEVKEQILKHLLAKLNGGTITGQEVKLLLDLLPAPPDDPPELPSAEELPFAAPAPTLPADSVNDSSIPTDLPFPVSDDPFLDDLPFQPDSEDFVAGEFPNEEK